MSGREMERWLSQGRLKRVTQDTDCFHLYCINTVLLEELSDGAIVGEVAESPGASETLLLTTGKSAAGEPN